MENRIDIPVRGLSIQVDAPNSLLNAEEGWAELPGGLIMQWGRARETVDLREVTFPRPFPTECLNIQVTEGTSASGAQRLIHRVGVDHSTISAIGFTMRVNSDEAGYTWTNWLAIGY